MSFKTYWNVFTFLQLVTYNIASVVEIIKLSLNRYKLTIYIYLLIQVFTFQEPLQMLIFLT